MESIQELRALKKTKEALLHDQACKLLDLVQPYFPDEGALYETLGKAQDLISLKIPGSALALKERIAALER